VGAGRGELNIEQMDNATRTARYRAGDFQMRTSLWTDDIADPSEITSYFAYSPTSRACTVAGRIRPSTSSTRTARRRRMPKSASAMYKQIQKSYMDAAPIIFLYESHSVASPQERQGIRADPARQ